MASVHNSKIGTLDKGAALTAENNPTGNGFVGLWEDVKDYTSVVITYDIVPDRSVSLYLQWAQGSTPPVDNPTIITENSFSILQPDSVQAPAEARWVRVVCEKIEGDTTFTVKIATLYKKAPTEISLTEDNSQIVSLNKGDHHNSIKTVFTHINSTIDPITIDDLNNNTNTSLYVSLTDNTGTPLSSVTDNRITTPFTYGMEGVAISSNGNCGSLVHLSLSEYQNNVTSIEIYDRTTLNISNNTINLPKQYATFSHGDIVNFFVYVKRQAVPYVNNYQKPDLLSDAVSVSNIATNGKIIAQARVNVINTDITHITFQLLVDVNTSNWFDKNSNQYKFDPYRYDLSGNPILHTDLFNIYPKAGSTLLYPGTYPLDMKLYMGTTSYEDGKINDYCMAAFQLVSKQAETVLHNSVNLSTASWIAPMETANQRSYFYNGTLLTSLKLNIMIDTHDAAPLNARPSASLFNSTQLTTIINTFCNAFPNTLQTKSKKVFLPSTGGGNYIVKAQVLTTYDTYFNAKTLTVQLNKDVSNNFINPTIPSFNRTYKFSPDRWLLLNTNNTTFGMEAYSVYIRPDVHLTDDTNNLIIVITSTLENIDDSYVRRVNFQYAQMLYNKIIVVAPYTQAVNNLQSHQIRTLTLLGGSIDNVIWYKDYNDIISSEFLNKLADRVIATSSASTKTPLFSHPANSAGISQASTGTLASNTSGVAMHYTITDNSANTIDTTVNSGNNTTNLNAMHISLAVPTGTANRGTYSNFSRLSSKNPLHVAVTTIHTPIYPLDTIITQESIDSPVYLTESTDPLININLNSIGFVNESPIPVWVRLYNITQQGVTDLKDSIRGTLNWNNVQNKEQKLHNRLAGYDNDGNNYNSANDKLTLNIAISPLSSRDLDLSIPIRFTNGIHVSASSSNKYTSIDSVGDHDVFLHGAWAPVSVAVV